MSDPEILVALANVKTILDAHHKAMTFQQEGNEALLELNRRLLHRVEVLEEKVNLLQSGAKHP